MDSYRRFDLRDHLIHVFQSQVLTSIPRGSRKPGGRTNHIFQQHQWVLKYPLCVKIEFRETAEWNAKSRVLKKERGKRRCGQPQGTHPLSSTRTRSPPPAEPFTGELGNAGPMPPCFPTEDPGSQEGPSENEPWPPRPRGVTSLLPSLCRHCYPCSTLLPGVNFLNGEQ